MGETVPLENLRAVVEALERSGVDEFTAAQIRERAPDLASASARAIDRALDQLWRAGLGIFPEGLGTDGTHLWRFGIKQAPSKGRRPIGR